MFGEVPGCRLVDAGIQNGKHFSQQLITTVFDTFRAARPEVDRFNLLDHYKARKLTVFRNRYVKRETVLRICDWAHNSQTCASVK